ncbi:MAG: putative cell wall-binding domain [Actinomycetia bacterium]|nr:putative cell wall-binding domain [Actinomycetes bacterium]
MRRRVLSSVVAFTLVAGLPAVAGGAEASGRVAGRVVDAGGSPLADVCVGLLGLTGGDLADTETGADGRYELTGLQPGSYVLLLEDCDPEPTYVGQTKEGVVVTAGATTTEDATLVAGGFVTGRITDDAGRPVGSACVHVVDKAELAVVTSTTSARDGRYRAGPLAAGGVLLLFADCRPNPSLVGQFLGGGLDPATARVTTISAGATAAADVALATGATISGRVDDGTGAAHEGACLRAAPPGRNPTGITINAATRARPDGTFTLGGLPPGTYHVGAGLCPATDIVGTDVTVTAGQAVSGLALTVPASHVARLAGADRVATAVAVASAQPSEAIVLVGTGSPVDALAAAPLAASLDAPLLLTPAGALAPSVLAYVQQHDVTDAVLLGGTRALGPAVEQALTAAGVKVDRVAGPDRYATAAAVAGRLDTSAGAYLVADDDWPDAVAIGTLAALEGRPILLVGRTTLPDATAEVIGGMATVDAVGGPGAISDAVLAAVARTVPHVGRVGGRDRYDTSARVARMGEIEGLPWEAAWVTSGRSWSDGLVAAVAAARGGGPLLLLGPATQQLLEDHADELSSLTVVGGPAQVPAAAYASLAALPAASCADTDRC